MTIAIGIISKGAIVVAADSQTTKGNAKRTDTQKITSVKFGRSKVLVVQAGNAGISARAIEILRESAKDADITDYRTVADFAQSAMIKVRQELRAQHLGCSIEELKEIIWKGDLQAELMLAYYFEAKPQLFRVDLGVGRADKSSYFTSLGSGSNLGEYLLCEHIKPDMNPGVVSVLAGYIIETVCNHDCTCSLPAKIGVLVDDVSAIVRSPNPEKIHHSAIGSSIIVIQSVDSNSSENKLLRRMIGSEKLRRHKSIERLLDKGSKRSVKQIEELIQNPSVKGLTKAGKTFGNLISFEHFNTRT